MIKNVLLILGLWLLATNILFAQNPLALSAINHIKSNASEYNLDASDFENWIITDEFTSTHNGITHIYFQQTKDGFPIFNATLTAAVNEAGEVKHVANRFEKLSSFQQVVSKLGISEETAIQKVAEHLNFNTPTGIQFQEERNGAKIYQATAGSTEAITVESVYVKNGKNLILTKQVAIYSDDLKEWWHVRVNSADGSLISQNTWTVECKWGSAHDCSGHHHDTKNGVATTSLSTAKLNNTNTLGNNLFMTNTYEVFALPLLDPNDGPRTIVTAPWNNATNASPYGWHDVDGTTGAEYTITRGNNVYAVEDGDSNNTPGYGPDGSSSLDFIYPLDLNQNPSGYQDASITNLFYWNNIIHDVFYQYGFDEASGNFQENNYGNGTGGGDSVNADAQDGSGTNNATFSAPPDGQNPRMSMFQWSFNGLSPATINSPASVVGNYDMSGAAFGAQTGTYNGTLVEVTPIEGCSALTNSNSVNGNIALIDRGNCPFVDKVLNAQSAGAIATVICNNTNTGTFTMSGTDPSITIPAVMLSQADCATIRTAMPGVDFSFVLDGPSFRDSDLDNGVIIHEYGHGISIRLTGGSSNSSCLIGDEQMGEGWSDYMALVMTMKPGDVGPDPIGMGAYLVNEPSTSNGIRSFPYSTNLSTNPLTYNDIKTQSIPHGVGTVWASMLWDMTWDLVAQYGYDSDIYNGTGGNNIAMQLVIDGMKLQPCNPGFVDGRDAILAADQINNGGANQCLIWEAFARRGLGFSASQGSTGSRDDGVEAFDVSPICQPILYFDKTATAFATPITMITYDLFLNNNTGTTLTNVNITDPIPAGTFLFPNTLTMGTYNASTTSVEVNQSSMPTGTDLSTQFQVFPAFVDSSELVHYENFDAATLPWTATTGQGASDFTVNASNPFRSGNVFIENVGADNTHFLTSGNYALPTNPIVSFWHDYDTEGSWDGGFIEFSNNGGTTWSDLGPYMILNGYNGTLGASSNNDIAGQDAFTGTSNGYIRTIADLEPFSNQTLQFRFVFGSDNNTFSIGWYIDDFIIYDGVTVENIACVTTNQGHNICDTTSTLVLPFCEEFILQFVDADKDGYGDPNNTGNGCIGADGFATNGTDCDDSDKTINPSVIDICDNIDNDCDGILDEDCSLTNCPATLTITSHPTQTYHAEIWIKSAIDVDVNDVIEYRAGNYIDLEPGFETKQGAYFDAIIEGCPTAPKPDTNGSANQ